ncbi:MAG: citrate transporter [Ruminococcus sp.]|nr:citrate transporter [Ruminococcus sp.]
MQNRKSAYRRSVRTDRVNGGADVNRTIEFIKKEAVLCAAVLLALISMFFVFPDKQYADYIDFRTLGILFSLMAVMEGMKSIGVFRLTAEGLLKRAGSIRSIAMILVGLCFFSSMIITNDVALITFVPFTIVTFRMLGRKTEDELLVPIVVMQTLAANLGSMLTPLGNPQNLYLYGVSGISLGRFIKLLLPFAALSFLMLFVWILVKTSSYEFEAEISLSDDGSKLSKSRFAVYLLLFAVCLLAVADVIHFAVAAGAAVAVLLIADRRLLGKIDYSLLLTFIGFFIFIGNMSRVEAINSFLSRIIDGNEFAVSVGASQVISNVPAALLLSGFSDNYEKLILGTDIGGLGTLIASMASLISFKCISKERPDVKKRYFLLFTVSNIVFLAVLISAYIIIY